MNRLRAAASAAIVAAAMLCTPAVAWASPAALGDVSSDSTTAHSGAAKSTLSVATIDADLSRTGEGDLAAELSSGTDIQALQVATAAQEQRPDVLVLTGVDVDEDGEVLASLRDEYLGVSRAGSAAMKYDYSFAASTNVGQPSGTDLDGDGVVGGPGDAYGHGDFPGQSSIVVLSTQPIDASNVRTFDDVLWEDIPGNHLKDAGLGSVAAQSIPLQSTSLWDIPISVGSKTVHVLATATTGGTSKADRLRRADQLSFLRNYVSGSSSLQGIADDQGRQGPLAKDSQAVIAGSLGSEAASRGPNSLLVNRAVQDPKQSVDAVSAQGSSWWGSALSEFLLDTSTDTRLSADEHGSRSDFALATPGLNVTGAGLREAVDTDGQRHRMVWLSVRP